MMFNTIPLAFGALMATIDVFMLSLVRVVSTQRMRMIRWMILPTIVYAIQPWIFLESLKYETLIVMNLMWDLVSDVLVTLTGYLYFGERIGPFKMTGVFFAFLAMILMSLTDGLPLKV